MAKTLPRTVLSAGVLWLSACYSFTPIEISELQPGMGVRARITPAAGARLAPLLGTQDARVLNGTLISNERDTMIVEVPTFSHTDAVNVAERLNQRVSIARTDLVELESRRPDRLRTAAVAGGAALVVGSIAIKALTGDPGKEKVPGGGGPEDALSPLFRRVP